jgi:hypothetical protein
MELKLRDDVTKREKLWFLCLVLFLLFWLWIVFYSGVLL